MQRSERAMRLVILSHLFEHLRKVYHLEWPRKAFKEGQLSEGELDGLLAFKTDPRLDSLRGALLRVRNRTFGFCLSCKREIMQRLLDLDPSRRLCAGCERQLSHAHPSGTAYPRRARSRRKQ